MASYAAVATKEEVLETYECNNTIIIDKGKTNINIDDFVKVMQEKELWKNIKGMQVGRDDE